jgi:hypothetical protein
MAKQYIVLEVGTISSGVRPLLRYVRTPDDFDFTIEHIDVTAGVASEVGDSTFNIRKGASLSSLTTIFAMPADRPKILEGETAGEVTGLGIDVAGCSYIVWDADAIPLGGLTGPVFLTITVEDGSAVAGDPGAVWRVGSTVPSNALGIDGDFYLRTTNGDVYERAAGVYSVVANIKGATGTAGAAGSNGAVWRTGSGAPSDGTGVDGDFYLRSSNGDVYLRAAGTYTVVANIKGATGAAGADATVTRADVVVTTASIADAAEVTGTVALGRSFFLLRIAADKPCRVRLYSTAAARTADASRPVGQDPSGEHGIIADFNLVTGNLAFDCAPVPVGANLEGSLSANIPYAIQNKSGSTGTVQVTFSRATLETGA